MDEPQFGAVILAAGLSSRMEEFKPLLHIGGKNLAEHTIGLFRMCGIKKNFVVVGHQADKLIPFVEAASSNWVINHNFRDGMFSSIQLGVKEVAESCDAFFLLPVDIPLVRPATIGRLMEAYSNDSTSRVYYPRYQSRRGHPPLIHRSLIQPILSYDGAEGMRGLLRSFREESTDVSVDDPFVLMDVDTQEDLSRLIREHSR